MADQPADLAPSDHDPARDADVIEFPTGSRIASRPDTRLRHVVGDVLREERQRQGRTLADVAEDAAVSVPYLSEIERGRKEVSSDVLHAVHEALGLDLREVLERSVIRLGTGRPHHRGPVMLAA